MALTLRVELQWRSTTAEEDRVRRARGSSASKYLCRNDLIMDGQTLKHHLFIQEHHPDQVHITRTCPTLRTLYRFSAPSQDLVHQCCQRGGVEISLP